MQEVQEWLLLLFQKKTAHCSIPYKLPHIWPASGLTTNTDVEIEEGASPEEVLQAYAPHIEQLKAHGGYVTTDVIDVNPKTSGLETMLAKFNIEHSHDEDEVRFIAGRGLFHIHPQGKPVVGIEVVAGDLIRVPRGTLHWFNLCVDRRIHAIRLFQDVSGWTPHYTSSGVDREFQPVSLVRFTYRHKPLSAKQGIQVEL